MNCELESLTNSNNYILLALLVITTWLNKNALSDHVFQRTEGRKISLAYFTSQTNKHNDMGNSTGTNARASHTEHTVAALHVSNYRKGLLILKHKHYSSVSKTNASRKSSSTFILWRYRGYNPCENVSSNTTIWYMLSTCVPLRL